MSKKDKDVVAGAPVAAGSGDRLTGGYDEEGLAAPGRGAEGRKGGERRREEAGGRGETRLPAG
jgi:hypothetical protein